jgi:hypothetical protein
MKNSYCLILILLFIPVMKMQGQGNEKKPDITGTWKFEAPYAPEDYKSGTLFFVIAEKEKKLTASMSFTGSEYKMPAGNVTQKGDSIMFSININGENVNMFLKKLSDTQMTGKAVYSEGEVPLTLAKNVAPAN